MEEPQQEGLQIMDTDLTSVMEWELLLKITRHMDRADRSSWRLVSKAACQAVYDSTAALAPCSVFKDGVATAAALAQLAPKCAGLRQLSCKRLPHLASVAGLLQLPLRLESLDISRTDAADLSFISRCPSLRRLTAECAQGPPDSGQLAAVIRQLPRLTALNLLGTELTADAALNVVAALQDLTGLEELTIGDVGLSRAAALLPAVQSLTGLRRLELCFYRLGPEALLPALQQLTQLQALRLAFHSQQAEDALALAPAIRGLRQLEALRLGGNKLRDGGAAALAPAIQQLTRLTALELGCNDFGAAAAQALAPALQHLTHLQDLDLSTNAIGSEGAAALAPALQALPGLLRLQLCAAALGAGGAAALAPALQRLPLLQHLDVGANAMGAEGLQALLPALQPLAALRSLRLGGNGLDGAEQLLYAVRFQQQLPWLETLVLGSCVVWHRQW